MSTHHVSFSVSIVKELLVNDKIEGKCHRLAFAAGLFHGETGVDSQCEGHQIYLQALRQVL